jgi:hypothetical protein
MSRRTQENIVAAALLALFAGVIWLCQDFGPRARMIPLPLAVFGIVLTLIQILWQNLRSTDELHIDMVSVQGPGAAAAAAKPAKRVTWRQEAGAFGIVGVLLGLILVTGIIPAVFLFTGGYFVVTRQYSWRASLIYTAILTAAVYLLFVVALQIQPYHGLLAPLVEHFR